MRARGTRRRTLHRAARPGHGRPWRTAPAAGALAALPPRPRGGGPGRGPPAAAVARPARPAAPGTPLRRPRRAGVHPGAALPRPAVPAVRLRPGPADRGAYGQHRLRDGTTRRPGARRCGTPCSTPASTAASTRTRPAPCTRNWSAAAPASSTCGWCATSRPSCPPGARAVAACSSAEWHEALAPSRWHRHQHPPARLVRARGGPVRRPDLARHPAQADRPRPGGHCLRRHRATWPRLAGGPPSGASWSPPTASARPSCAARSATTGEMLESGYPRNDLLYASDRAEVADRGPAGARTSPRASASSCTRPPGATTSRYRAGQYRLRPPTRPGRRRAPALGDDHVLLVRRHYLVGGRRARRPATVRARRVRHPGRRRTAARSATC